MRLLKNLYNIKFNTELIVVDFKNKRKVATFKTFDSSGRLRKKDSKKLGLVLKKIGRS